MHRDYKTPLIMWTWQDAQVEDHRLIEEALADMKAHGLSGALAMLRGCRYEVSDPMVIAAARHAAETSHRLGLSFWFAIDPRLDQGRLLQAGEPAVYLLPQRDSAGNLPCEGRVTPDGRFSVRVEYGRPRGQHMLSQVAATYQPDGIERVFTYQKNRAGQVIAASVQDVTGASRLFLQRAQGYLEVFGQLQDLTGEGWHVLALTRFASTYPDLGSPRTRRAVADLYRTYHEVGVHLDGVLWDEIGYVTGYGSDRSRLPYGAAISKEFRNRSGLELADHLLYLLLDDDQGRFADLRRRYYEAVAECVFGAQEFCYQEAQRLWGPGVESGIHQTWHQNADDLPHGSADWWRGSRALSGGYTDVGNAEEWDRVDQYAQILAMAATAVSLARYHQRPMAFYNLWGVNFGEPDSPMPADVMNWWSHLMSAMGIVWLAHTYGPNGYIDNFTNWGPGYPNHPTWALFPAISERTARLRELTDAQLPEANVALVWPLGHLSAIGNSTANGVSDDVLRLIANLQRCGVALDILSPDLFRAGKVENGVLCVPTPRGAQRYEAVIYPYAEALLPSERDLLVRLEAAGVPVHLSGSAQAFERACNAGLELPRLVQAPEGALAYLFRRTDGDLTVTVVPAEYGRPVTGTVTYGSFSAAVDGLRGIAAFRLSAAGELLDSFVYEGSFRS